MASMFLNISHFVVVGSAKLATGDTIEKNISNCLNTAASAYDLSQKLNSIRFMLSKMTASYDMYRVLLASKK